jgi:hypothetical protein
VYREQRGQRTGGEQCTENKEARELEERSVQRSKRPEDWRSAVLWRATFEHGMR